MYNVEISDGLVSKIVEKITPEIAAWQNRPLDAVYPFIFMDAIHYKVKENHQYITKRHMWFWEFKWTDVRIFLVFG